MTREVRLWQIDNGGALRELAQQRLDLEAKLEAWLVNDISILDPDLLVIGKRVATDHNGEIDLLCIDREGDLVVVELKRDKTPREVTAQALDYASWVKDLPAQRIEEIAAKHLGGRSLAAAFESQFSVALPEAINEDHRMVIVGSRIDDATERIIEYLSGTHGVRINAATFEHFKQGDKSLLARVFLIQPEAVEGRSRAKGQSKRRPDYTPQEWAEIVRQHGVSEIFGEVFDTLGGVMPVNLGLSMMTFRGDADGKRKAIVNLLPLDSSTERGLCVQVYTTRLAKFLEIQVERVIQALPRNAEPWSYQRSSDPDWSGKRFFLRDQQDIERFTALFPPNPPVSN